ncbi:WD40 repeat-like protein [Violaceomyces palustris]|uniref:WD40 repeat-like protein n=1 Tax=Violaceomyces palustris TaxID=1673888 RepID=A0ACD0P432_9BASI|nr:WD40 repeat-like protein [Violaceomyces palustris]
MMDLDYVGGGGGGIQGSSLSGPNLVPSPTLNQHRPGQAFHSQTLPPPSPPSSATKPSSSPYLTHLLSIASPNPCLLALSDDSTISVIDKSTYAVVLSTRLYQKYSLTQLQPLPPTISPSAWLASVTDGTVTQWDLRSQDARKPVILLRGPSNSPYLSVASPTLSNPNLIAAGTELHGVDASVDIWDLRNARQPLHQYTESHSDDVTSLHFHPEPGHSDVLLTASTDGLICAIDTKVQDENDAVIAVGNTNSSVARANWGGGRNESWRSGRSRAAHQTLESDDARMDDDDNDDDELNLKEEDSRRKGLGSTWAIGDMQTLSVWDADKFDPLLEPLDVRSATCLKPAWSTDYVIDAFTTSQLGMDLWNPVGGREGKGKQEEEKEEEEDSITLFLGDQRGSVSIVTVVPEPSGGGGSGRRTWSLESILPCSEEGLGRSGHNDIVRCVDWDPINKILHTGGEDSKLCCWKLDHQSPLSYSAMVDLGNLSNLQTGTVGGGLLRHGGGGDARGGRFANATASQHGGKHTHSLGPSSQAGKRWKPYG